MCDTKSQHSLKKSILDEREVLVIDRLVQLILDIEQIHQFVVGDDKE